jgi:hypothetical protein
VISASILASHQLLKKLGTHVIVSEIGIDMSRFPSAPHLICPDSAGPFIVSILLALLFSLFLYGPSPAKGILTSHSEFVQSVVKQYGIVALAKSMVQDQKSYGLESPPSPSSPLSTHSASTRMTAPTLHSASYIRVRKAFVALALSRSPCRSSRTLRR